MLLSYCCISINIKLMVLYICFTRNILIFLVYSCLLFLLFGFANICALQEFVKHIGWNPTSILMKCGGKTTFWGRKTKRIRCVRSVLGLIALYYLWYRNCRVFDTHLFYFLPVKKYSLLCFSSLSIKEILDDENEENS